MHVRSVFFWRGARATGRKAGRRESTVKSAAGFMIEMAVVFWFLSFWWLSGSSGGEEARKSERT